MWSLLLACAMLASASSHPVDQETTLTYTATTEVDQHAVHLQKTVDLVGFIENFKQVMAAYVNSQYKNLTIAEMERVKMTLEEFLQNFATDLRETIDNKNTEDVIITDEVNEQPFAEIKRKIVVEFPEVTPDVADRIIVKLRKNLYMTRNKLDEIIRESQRAQLENAK